MLSIDDKKICKNFLDNLRNWIFVVTDLLY